ncbi:MAG: DUF739 family protein [Bacillota bacterium]
MKKARKRYHELKALKGKMRSEGQTTKTMAEFLGIAPNTFSLKINGISEFTCSEIGEVCKILSIEPKSIVEYFFPSMFRDETRKAKGA